MLSGKSFLAERACGKQVLWLGLEAWRQVVARRVTKHAPTVCEANARVKGRVGLSEPSHFGTEDAFLQERLTGQHGTARRARPYLFLEAATRRAGGGLIDLSRLKNVVAAAAADCVVATALRRRVGANRTGRPDRAGRLHLYLIRSDIYVRIRRGQCNARGRHPTCRGRSSCCRFPRQTSRRFPAGSCLR